MIINSENNKLSRNRKSRIDRRIESKDDIKLLFKKIKTEKKKENKNFDKIKQLGILLIRNKYADKPYKLENALRELNKIQVIVKI